MAQSQDTTKIFRIEVPGIEAAIGKLQQLNQEFALLKAIKQEANKVLAANSGDVDVIEKQTKLLAENEIALKKNTAERKIASKEADVLVAASRKIAEAHMNEVNATKYVAGSYNQLYASYKALLDQYKNTPTTSPFFDEIKQKAVEAKQRVDEFNRSLSPDGTLVGEYKTGILNAFKSVGLTDLLKNQKAQIEAHIKDLSRQNEELAKRFKESGEQGKDAFQKMEAQLSKNVETQTKLKTNLDQINTTLKGTGSIGETVTKAIGEGFKDIITAGLSVVGVTLGLHAAFEFLKDSIKEFSDAELKVQQFNATLENVGRSDVIPLITHQVDELKKKFEFLNKSDILDVFRKLVDYGKLSGKQLNDLVPVIINFAAKQRIPLQQASDTIVKALEGNQRGLQEFGIHLSKTSTEAERFTAVMDALQEKTKGAAEVFGHSAAGELETHRQKLVDIREEIGKNLLPILVKMGNVAEKASKGLKPLFEDLWSLLTLGSNGTIAEHEAQRDFEAQQEQIRKAHDQATQQQIKDRIKQYEEAIKQGVITREAALKGLNDRLLKKTDDQFNTDVTTGVIAGLDTKKIGFPKDNEDEARKARLKRIAQIESDSITEQIALEKNREKGKINEKQYQIELFNILQKYEKLKMEVLTEGSTEEIKESNQIQLQLIKDKRTFLDKMFSLDKESLEARKNSELQAAQFTLDRVIQNPNSSEVAKLNAQVVFDNQKIEIEKKFNDAMDVLEKQFAKKSEKNASDRAKALFDIEQKRQKDLFDLSEAAFKHILDQVKFAEEFQKGQIEVNKNRQLVKALDDSTSKRDLEIKEIESKATVDSINAEIDAVKKQIFFYNLRYGALAIAIPQYRQLIILLGQLSLSEKQTKIQLAQEFANKFSSGSTQNTESVLQDQLANRLGFGDSTDKKQSAEKKLLGDIIASSYDTAKLAMDSYFNAEQSRIEQSRQLAQDRIDLEATIAKGRAQSQAEIAAIDQQAAVKKKEVDKKALEETKKIKKAEAKIALATELANIAVAAAGNPLNPLTFGSAGIAEYAILAALAFARYAFNIQSINSATSFAKGGKLSGVLGEGGEFGGRPHTQGGNKFMFHNMPVETEAREAYIVNKFATQHPGIYTVTGTPKQIASSINEIGGGKRFAPGATMYRRMDYGGMLGETVLAPVNPGSFLGSGGSGSSELKGSVESLIQGLNTLAIQTNERIDRIEVVQVTKTVQQALKKQVRNDQISTL
jgi:hypothetical protein